MSYHYTIHPAENLVVVVASGRVAGEEVIASVEEMAQDPRWIAGMHQLCDYRQMKAIAISLPEVKHLAQLEQRDIEKLRGGRLAMVADAFEVASLCQLYAALIRFRGRQARVFRTMEEALGWLGVPAAPLEAHASG
jgi:hypothetical protein